MSAQRKYKPSFFERLLQNESLVVRHHLVVIVNASADQQIVGNGLALKVTEIW
jgi:hypothetical protein